MAITSTRAAIPAAVLAAAALALTGCSAHASNTASDASGHTAASAPAPGAKAPDGNQGWPGSGATGSGTTGSGTTGSGASSPSAAAGGPATGPGTASGDGVRSEAATAHSGSPCLSSQLSVARTDPDTGAGQSYAKITFTNTAATSCTLAGYPGVSYVKAAGAQSGDPARRTGAGYHTVTLAAHGGHASAVMHDSNGLGGYSPAQCDLTSVKGIRVYPPGEKAAMYIPFATRHCAGTGIHPLTIGPVS